MANYQTLFPLEFSSSMMDDVWKCDLYFFRKHCQHYVGALFNPDLIAGGHFAKACEIVRVAYHNEGFSQEDAIDAGYTYILTAKDTGSVEKSNERLAYCLKKYFTKFPLSDGLQPCKLVDGSYAVEYEFVFELGGENPIKHPDFPDRNICFRGKLDELVEKTVFNETQRFVLDEKTTARIHRVGRSKEIDIPKEEDSYKTHGQFIAYHWAARQLGVDTTCTLVRRVPILSDFEPAFELKIPVNNWMIERWCIATFSKIQELVEKYKYWKEHKKIEPPNNVFYPVYSNVGCFAYNRQCEYVEGCKSPHGEAILFSANKQLYHNRHDESFIPLETMLARLK